MHSYAILTHHALIHYTHTPCTHTMHSHHALTHPRYAALTHAAYDALARKAREGEVAPKCYRSQVQYIAYTIHCTHTKCYRSQKYLSEMGSINSILTVY
jgi:hypothetical protein